MTANQMHTPEARARATAGRELTQNAEAALNAANLDLPIARRALVLRQLANMPPNCRATYLRSQRAKPTPRTSIKAFCQNCMGYDDYRAGIRDCTSLGCPLYTMRPYQT